MPDRMRRSRCLATMPHDEHGYLIVPHEVATGPGCDGCLIVRKRGTVADLVCNVCEAVIDTVPVERSGPRLMELASAEFCGARCALRSTQHLPRFARHRIIRLL